MQGIHNFHHRLVVHGFIRTEEDRGVFLTFGQRIQRRNHVLVSNGVIAEEHGFIRLHRQIDRFFRTRLRLAGGRRQIDLHVNGRQRRRHHKDDQQHQHDVDKRRHVDVVHFAVIIEVFVKMHRHKALTYA